MEFKAWFDVYTERSHPWPTLRQRAVINERVADVDGFPVTSSEFAAQYWRRLIGRSRENDARLATIMENGSFDSERAMRFLATAEKVLSKGAE